MDESRKEGELILTNVKTNEIYLELKDEYWPNEGIDHTRNIVRSIVYDDEDNYYFVHCNRDDDFGKEENIETAGGGVEENEDLISALKRELKEELGFEVEVISKLGVVKDYYNLLHRCNISNYYLCKVVSFGDTRLTDDEKNKWHLETVKYTYDEALAMYKMLSATRLGKLLRQREVPMLIAAKEKRLFY